MGEGGGGGVGRGKQREWRGESAGELEKERRLERRQLSLYLSLCNARCKIPPCIATESLVHPVTPSLKNIGSLWVSLLCCAVSYHILPVHSFKTPQPPRERRQHLVNLLVVDSNTFEGNALTQRKWKICWCRYRKKPRKNVGLYLSVSTALSVVFKEYLCPCINESKDWGTRMEWCPEFDGQQNTAYCVHSA